MTSKIKLAIIIEESHNRLKKHTHVLAQQANIPAPDLSIPKKYDLDYRRAMELQRISIFIQRLAECMPDNPELFKLVSKPKATWSKQEVMDLVLGVPDG